MREKKQLNIFLATLPLIVVIVFGVISAFIWKTGMYIPLIISVIVAAIISNYIGYSWEEIEKSLVSGVITGLPAIFILILVGAIIGSWMQSGIIPTMIYYSLKIINPNLFIPASFVIVSIIATIIGSAFASIATIGLALMATGLGMGMPASILAGAIISGAFFGNTLSPLSDILNLSSSMTKINLYEIIIHLAKILIPTFFITAGLYYIFSLPYIDSITAESQSVKELLEGINHSFIISPWLLIIPLITIILSLRRTPTLPSLAISIFLGFIATVFVQKATVSSAIIGITSGTTSSTGIEVVDILISNGGILSMSNTIMLTIIATALGGILEQNGFLGAIVREITKLIKNNKGLILVTILTSTIIGVATSSQLVAIIIPIAMFSNEYIKKNLEINDLVRLTVATGGSNIILIPWSIPTIYAANVFNIQAVEFIPYLFFPIVVGVIGVINGLFFLKSREIGR